MGDLRRSEAVETVARAVVHHRLTAPHQNVGHADYSDLADAEWAMVEAYVKRLADSLTPTVAEFEAAYEFLANI